jgi:mRNA interferase MazF
MRRGEVWEAQLVPRSGSEQSGTRPVVILSNDGFNAVPTWQSIIVVPTSTSEKQRARGLTAVPLKTGAGGLRRSSVALCHQITTLDRAKLTKQWGTLNASDLRAIEEGIRAALDM